MWVSAEEAVRRLSVKPQTLYASVSRGRVRAKPDPADPRRSLYDAADIDRLAERRGGRRAAGVVAAETIRWGEPVLQSAISTVIGGRLYYRGKDAAVLAESATLEAAAELLWATERPIEPTTSNGSAAKPGLPAMFASLARTAPTAPHSRGLGPRALIGEATNVFGDAATALCGAGEGPVHLRLARRWRRTRHAEIFRRALVLLADHELNASTFAARVAVSTGASLPAGTLAGLATLTGPLHGTSALALRLFARRAKEIGVPAAMRERLAEGRPLPALGHPLYPDGDVRAKALVSAFDMPPLYRELAAAAEDIAGEAPNIDFALAALADALDLPESAPVELFALARTVGWLAHMLEQAESGVLIRPRARYIGPMP